MVSQFAPGEVMGESPIHLGYFVSKVRSKIDDAFGKRGYGRTQFEKDGHQVRFRFCGKKVRLNFSYRSVEVTGREKEESYYAELYTGDSEGGPINEHVSSYFKLAVQTDARGMLVHKREKAQDGLDVLAKDLVDELVEIGKLEEAEKQEIESEPPVRARGKQWRGGGGSRRSKLANSK